MYLEIFSPKKSYIKAISIILFSCLFPSIVHSACGTIPATYPLFSDSKLKFEKNILVNGNNVSKGEYKPKAAIDINGTVSTNVNLSLPSLDPSIFPSNNSNTDLTIKNSTTINHSSEVFYNKIKIDQKNITVNFTGGGPFHIDKLEVKKQNVTLNFAAGTYYIDEFKIDAKNVTLNISSGPVIFHIGNKFKIDDKDANINTGGNVDDFRVYLHSGAEFKSEKENLNFTGLIYGPDNVDKVEIEGKNSSFHGAIIVSGGEIKTKKKDISFTYTTADQTAIGNISTCQSGGGGGDTAASNFNCVENGTDGISGNLYTKAIAQSFSIDIVALQNASTIETNFASGTDHTVTVELVDASSGICSTYPSFSSHNLLFTSADSGTKASNAISSSTAYSKVKCRITDTTDSPSVVGCSTDSFAIRPTNLSISSTDLFNTNSPTDSLTPTTKAGGTTFNITATASTGYAGTPSIDNTIIQTHSGAVATGNIAESFDPAISATGSASGSFSYPEVGWFRFPVQGVFDDSYTELAQDEQNGDCIINSANQNDNFSDTPNADGKIGCKFGNKVISNYFGRFTPDHFEITATQDGSFSDACSGFSYSGQSVSYATNPNLTITAYNAIGGITQNYRQSYAKLDPLTDFNVSAPTTDSSQLGVDTTNKVNLVWTSGTSSLTDNLDGSLTFSFGNDSFTYLHEANSLIAPFPAAVDLIFTAITDSDGITTQGLPQTLQPSGTSIRFGRLNIDNAHGSELSPLPVPIYTEYYNGTFFVAATDDSCTTINLVDLRFNGAVTPSLGTTTVSAGLNFTAPGTGNTGYIDITTDLFISLFPWLAFDWDGDGSHDNSPSARASFGLYKGNSKQIYIREIY